MRKVILYVASSLDGYIAGINDELDWLFTDNDYGYKDFLNSIDTTLSGYKTHMIGISFAENPYPDKQNYVFSKNHIKTDKSNSLFIGSSPSAFVKQLKKQDGGNI